MFYNYSMILVLLFNLLAIGLFQQCPTCPQQCGDRGKCIGCDSGFSLDNTGACGRFTPIQGCQLYSIQTGKCHQCFPGNLLQSGICQPLIPNCNFTLTNNTNLCTQCNDTYILVNGVKCYSGLTSNCSSGSLPRLLPNGQAYCQPFPLQKCTTPSTTSSYCLTCQPNYTNINGICFNLIKQTNCPSNICNCRFYYYKNNCYQFNLENCLQSKDKVYCDLCDDGLVLVSGRCVVPVKVGDIHCNVLALNSDICQGCNFQYILNPNYICVPQFQLCTDPTLTCQQQCNTSTLLYYNGNCYIKDPFCIAYDTVKYQCVECYDGYRLNEVGICEQREKCVVYAGDGSCVRCFTSYQLNVLTRNCDKLPFNCRQLNSTTGACTTCSNSTTLIFQSIPINQTYSSNLSIAINISLCVYSTSNCLYYNTFGFCQICLPSYIQKNRQCVAVATNCAVVAAGDRTRCQVCGYGYVLDSATLTCFTAIEGCEQYGSSKTCVLCNAGYSLINGLCFYKDVNCLQYNPSGNCLRCQNSLIPFYNRCVFYDAYCSSYDSNGICNKTFGGFIQSAVFSSSMQANYKSFVAFVRNIFQSSSAANSFTQLSIFGGYYTPQGWIKVLPTTGLYHDRISQYDVNGNIRSCKDGYTLVSGDCVLRIDYCASYSPSTGHCTRCLPSYHLSTGRKCLPSTPSICPIPSPTGDTCLTCNPPYTLILGQCYLSSLNVLSYSSTNSSQISSVQNGYFIYTKYQIAWPFDSNCVRQQQPGMCLQCGQQGYGFIRAGMRLVGGVCVVVRENCAKYSDRGLCSGCVDGYMLRYGSCYPNNCFNFSPYSDNCLTCPSSMTYQAGLCFSKPQPNCLVYAPITTLNLTTTPKPLTSCLFCSPGYYLTPTSTCSLMIPNCYLTDSQSGRCTQCLTNYILYQDSCIKQIPGCQTYNISTGYSTCSKCIANYNLLNGQCYTLPSRCIKLNSLGACAVCQLGYVAIVQNNVSMCVFPTANCVTYSGLGRCLVCATNYVLQNNLCNFYLPGCVNVKDTGQCQACAAEYLLDPSTGLCKLKFCLNYNQQKCITCSNANDSRNSTGNCLKNKTGLIKISSFGQYSGTQYKPGQSLETQLLYCIMYNPPPYASNFLSILTPKPQIIHYIQLQGSPSGYVTQYLIQFRNNINQPFICWNSCQKIKGNVNGTDMAQLQLLYPIIANEIRFYPVSWVGGIWMRIDILVQGQ